MLEWVPISLRTRASRIIIRLIAMLVLLSCISLIATKLPVESYIALKTSLYAPDPITERTLYFSMRIVKYKKMK